MLHVADVASFPTTENATTSRPFPHRVEQAFGLPIESGSTIAAFEARNADHVSTTTEPAAGRNQRTRRAFAASLRGPQSSSSASWRWAWAPLAAAEYEALYRHGCAGRNGSDMVTVNNIALGFAILFAVIVLVVGFGIWSMVRSDRDMMDGE